MPRAVPLVKLNNGQSMPAFGLGTWQMDESEAETAVKQAIDLGYRHFDTAFIYHNEIAIGKAIRQKIQEGVVKREDIFVVSKLWNTCHALSEVLRACRRSHRYLYLGHIDMYLVHWPFGVKLWNTCHARSEVLPACRRSHRYLSLGHIDLYLVHWPFGVKSKTESGNPQVFDSFDDTSLEDTWREMEKCVDEGLVRSIGLSNFNSVQVLRIVNIARIKPVCNQIEVHVGFNQRPLTQYCRERNVEIVGYCPLGAPNRPVKRRNEKTVLDQPAVMQMASTHGKTPAQIALRYLVQLGVTPIPKSNTKHHLRDNINIFDFELSKAEMETLDSLNSEDRIMMYPLARHHLDWPFKIPY